MVCLNKFNVRQHIYASWYAAISLVSKVDRQPSGSRLPENRQHVKRHPYAELPSYMSSRGRRRQPLQQVDHVDEDYEHHEQQSVFIHTLDETRNHQYYLSVVEKILV